MYDESRPCRLVTHIMYCVIKNRIGILNKIKTELIGV